MDKSVSVRALKLRNRILNMGFPCAVSFPPFPVDHLRPVLCILTFVDACDMIRRSSLDDVPALVVGNGFVSSLFVTEHFETEEMMLESMEYRILKFCQTKKSLFYGDPGYLLPGGFLVTEHQIYYRIFSLRLTERERRILTLILQTPDIPNNYRRIEAYTYPYPYAQDRLDVVNSVTVHISAINRKAMEITGRKLIRYRNDSGYILEVRRPNKKE